MSPMTSTNIDQLNKMNRAAQNAGLGTLLGLLEPAGTTFFVDGNAGLDTNNGLSWGTAFKTLTVALAASNAAIAATSFGWAARNIIYAKADAFEENLVLLAQKTDIIGVGSYAQWSKCGLVGNHVPTGTTASFGTRFFNFYMRAGAAGGDIWTLDSTCSSFGLYDCTIDSQSAVAATGGVVATASPYVQLVGNEFRGKFSDAVIEFGTGDARGTRILGNYIEGANAGIEFGAGTTDSAGATEQYILVKDNVIFSATECINDAADIVRIVNNNCVTAQAKGSAGAGAIVGNELLSSGNKISASNLANADWPALGTL